MKMDGEISMHSTSDNASERIEDLVSQQTARKTYLDRFGHTFSNQCAKFLIEPVTIDSDEAILDVATGPGTAVFECLCKFGNSPSIIGIDASLEMLQGAESIQNAIWEKCGVRPRFIHGDVHHLPFANETFDGVMSNLGIHLFSERIRAISEMGRVLKSSGFLLISIPYLIPESYNVPPVTNSTEPSDFVRELVECSGKEYSILDEIIDELEKNGFSDVKATDTVIPYTCNGAQEVIGLIKTVLHFSGCMARTEQLHAFAELDNLLYSHLLWGDTNTYTVQLGVARILCIKSAR